jgi:hypothetical protein
MKPECSLPCSQGSAAEHYPKPVEPTPHRDRLLLCEPFQYVIVSPFTSRFRKPSLPFLFSYKNVYTSLIFSIRTTFSTHLILLSVGTLNTTQLIY